MEKVTKISAIYFTYKRAILLDASLKSIQKNFINLDENINVIYHYNSEHHPSYQKLLKNFSKNVNFIKRTNKNILLNNPLFLLRPLNLLWFLRWRRIVLDFNNFKYILENILKNSKTDFVTLVPDDQIFYKKTLIPNKALELISENKNQTYYRFFTGNHFKGKYSLPKKMNVDYYNGQGINFFKWSNEDRYAKNLWKYRFTIEGTIFHKDALIKFLQPILYHNPITLEALGLWESRFRNFFKYGISSSERTAASYNINNVQNLVKTPNSGYSTDFLMKCYMNGAKISCSTKDFSREKLDIVPSKLYLKKNNKKFLLKYSINKFC